MQLGVPLKLGALLAAVVAVLVLSAAVLAAGKAGDSRPSSNYLGPPKAESSSIQAVHGSNRPARFASSAVAPRPSTGNNRPTTP